MDNDPINPPLRLFATFQQMIGIAPSLILAVPDREMWVLVAPDDEQPTDAQYYTIIVPDLESRTVFDVRGARLRQTKLNRPLPSWARYIALALLALSDEGLQIPPAQLFIAGDEPPGPRYDYVLGMAFATYGYHHNAKTCDADCLVNMLEKAARQYGG
jgi:hypothetical protein